MNVTRCQRSPLKISMARFTHGHRHNTDMDTNRENDTTVRDRENGTTVRDRDTNG